MDMLSAAGGDNPADTLRPLLEAPLDNALAQGDAALTGPIVRGDVQTVGAHLDDLTANAPQTLASYIALARATLSRATSDGRLLPIRALKIARLLENAEPAPSVIPVPGAAERPEERRVGKAGVSTVS